MASSKALIFAITYSFYTQSQSIYGDEYGLVYLGPGQGFLSAVWVLVPRIDTVYNRLTKKHNGEAKPEYRLPLANIGSVLIPISLFGSLEQCSTMRIGSSPSPQRSSTALAKLQSSIRYRTAISTALRSMLPALLLLVLCSVAS